MRSYYSLSHLCTPAPLARDTPPPPSPVPPLSWWHYPAPRTWSLASSDVREWALWSVSPASVLLLFILILLVRNQRKEDNVSCHISSWNEKSSEHRDWRFISHCFQDYFTNAAKKAGEEADSHNRNEIIWQFKSLRVLSWDCVMVMFSVRWAAILIMISWAPHCYQEGQKNINHFNWHGRS